MRCQETSGFLVLHRCEGMATYTCMSCGRKVCEAHAVVPPAGTDIGPAAPGQPGKRAAQPDPSAPGTGRICQTCAGRLQPQAQQQGNPYYEEYHYRPYYYGTYYDDADRGVFGSKTSRGAGEEGDALGS